MKWDKKKQENYIKKIESPTKIQSLFQKISDGVSVFGLKGPNKEFVLSSPSVNLAKSSQT